MTPARLQSIERNLTGIARKVLEATPVAESWSVQRIYAELGKTIIMVTHDPRAAQRADRIVHLEKGRLVDEPTPLAAHA